LVDRVTDFKGQSAVELDREVSMGQVSRKAGHDLLGGTAMGLGQVG
jgi:hypothetical protein